MSMVGAASGVRLSALATLREGIRFAPEFTRGIRVTLALALVATAGRVMVPIAVQQTVDRGRSEDGGPRPGFVAAMAAVAACAVVVGSVRRA